MFEKTEEGRKAIQARHVRLSPCQRAVLITVNGTQSTDDLALTAAKMGGGPADVEALITLGLIASVQLATAQAGPGIARPANNAISMDSLWPESMGLAAAAPLTATEEEVTEDIHFDDDTPEASSSPDIQTAKAFALTLLEPLGLRAIQLRRTVEAAQTPQQLRALEHLIRELLTEQQNEQLDSAFFGL